jgi:hypothetical protein
MSTTKRKLTEYTTQYLQNVSADTSTETPILRRALVGKTASGAYTTQVAEYGLNDVLEVGDVTYLGKEAGEDKWLVLKIDSSSGTSFRYASIKNNSTITTYSDAWSNYATLTYETYPKAL